MNFFEKSGFFFKALARSNKHTMFDTIKNVYRQYGWQGVKDAIVNKAHGKPIVPEDLLDPGAAYIKRIQNEKNNIGREVFLSQQSELSSDEILNEISRFEYKPLISIIMPLYNAPVNWLEVAVRSFQNQYYENWELCVADDGSIDGRGSFFIKELSQEDKRIRLVELEKNSGISVASNAALNIARGEYIALVDQDDEITPDAFFWIAKEINQNRDVDFIYTDECVVEDTPEQKKYDFMFKPDWSPMLLLNIMYTGHLTVYRTEIVKEAGGFRSAFDFSQDYDLALRVYERAKKICHVERLLYLWRAVPTSVAAGAKKFAETSNTYAVKDWYVRQGLKPIINHIGNGNYAKVVLEKNPLVSIVVPTDSYENITKLMYDITIISSYTNYEFVPVVNSLVASKIEQNYPHYDNLTICRYDKVFNFSDKCNEGARMAAGEILIFFNDDAYPKTADWIERLLDCLYLPGVGGASPAMLYEATKTMQYAGGIIGHPYSGMMGPSFHHKDFRDVAGNKINQLHSRDVSVLSGACMAIKKDIFSDMGGFDAVNTPNGHSDVDFSLRLLEKGLRCVYTPFSCLIHDGGGTWNGTRDKAYVYCLKRFKEYLKRDRYYSETMKKHEYLTHNLPYRIYYPDVFDGSKDYKGDILLISHELSRTGAPLVLFDMAREMKEEGYFVVVISAQDGPLREDMLDDGLVVIVDESLGWDRFKEEKDIPVDDINQFDFLISNFDLVVANTMSCHNLVIRYNNKKIPIIWWLHEGDFTLKRMTNCMPSKLGANIKVVCAESYVQDMLKQFNYNYETELMMFGVEDMARETAFAPKNKLRFVLIGSYELRKGHDLFIRAIETMPVEYQKKAEFVFAGKIHEPDVYDMVMEFCAKNENAKAFQAISREEVYRIYEDTVCVVAPSRDDPMPIVIIEAFMLSKIAICSDKTGASYFIQNGESGFVIKNEDYMDLSSKMMYVIDNYDRMDEMREKGRKIYEQYFRMDIFKNNVRKLVENNIKPF